MEQTVGVRLSLPSLPRDLSSVARAPQRVGFLPSWHKVGGAKAKLGGNILFSPLRQGRPRLR